MNENNKEKIFTFLMNDPLTVKELSLLSGLDENNVRTYVNRLRKENRIRQVGMEGRYKKFQASRANFFENVQLGIPHSDHPYENVAYESLQIAHQFYRQNISEILGGIKQEIPIYQGGRIELEFYDECWLHVIKYLKIIFQVPKNPLYNQNSIAVYSTMYTDLYFAENFSGLWLAVSFVKSVPTMDKNGEYVQGPIIDNRKVIETKKNEKPLPWSGLKFLGDFIIPLTEDSKIPNNRFFQRKFFLYQTPKQERIASLVLDILDNQYYFFEDSDIIDEYCGISPIELRGKKISLFHAIKLQTADVKNPHKILDKSTREIIEENKGLFIYLLSLSKNNEKLEDIFQNLDSLSAEEMNSIFNPEKDESINVEYDYKKNTLMISLEK
jgi:hypothetical protein